MQYQLYIPKDPHPDRDQQYKIDSKTINIIIILLNKITISVLNSSHEYENLLKM